MHRTLFLLFLVFKLPFLVLSQNVLKTTTPKISIEIDKIKSPIFYKDSDKIIVYGQSKEQSNVILFKVYDSNLELLTIKSVPFKKRMLSSFALQKISNWYCLYISSLGPLEKLFLDANFNLKFSQRIGGFSNDYKSEFAKSPFYYYIKPNSKYPYLDNTTTKNESKIYRAWDVFDSYAHLIDQKNQKLYTFEKNVNSISDTNSFEINSYKIFDSLIGNYKYLNWTTKLDFHFKSYSKICSFDDENLYVLVNSSLEEYLFCLNKKNGEIIFKTKINPDFFNTSMISKISKIDGKIVVFGDFYSDKINVNEQIFSGYFCAEINENGIIEQRFLYEFPNHVTEKTGFKNQKEHRLTLCNAISKTDFGYYFLLTNYGSNGQYVQNYEVLHLDANFQLLDSKKITQKSIVRSFFKPVLTTDWSYYDPSILKRFHFTTYYDFFYAMRGSGNFKMANNDFSSFIYISEGSNFFNTKFQDGLIKVSNISQDYLADYSFLYLEKIHRPSKDWKYYYQLEGGEDLNTFYGLFKIKSKYYLEKNNL